MSKLMLVDDDPTTTDLLKLLMELDGFEVKVVNNGGGVIAAAESFLPDIILMDYHLNDMHGVDVLRNIRAHPTLHQLPVVIGSGMNVEDEVMAAGATMFLVKPYEPSDLSPLFKRLIG
jgi:CheY-like chemotaxis protein